MKLRGRLKLVADKVVPCATLCDIGTDHAYLPIYLVERGVCVKAIASDIRKGPVEAAVQNVQRFGLEAAIEVRLGNGLETVAPGEVNAIVIAGMGGKLIAEILSKGIDRAQKAQRLVLQPMNDADILRRWLCGNGFEIVDEELAAEGERIYNVIAARWTGITCSTKEIFYHIGHKLVDRKDPLLGRLIGKKVRELEKVIRQMGKTKTLDEQMLKKVTGIKTELEKLLMEI